MQEKTNTVETVSAIFYLNMDPQLWFHINYQGAKLIKQVNILGGNLLLKIKFYKCLPSVKVHDVPVAPVNEKLCMEYKSCT